MKLQKIVFLTTQMGPGGAETQIFRLAMTLQNRGYDVTVISMLPAIGFVDALKDAGVRFYSLDMNRGAKDLRALYTLVTILRQIRPEVLANFCFHANVLGSVAGRLARVPVVITSIRNEFFGPRPRDYVERMISSMKLSDLTITNSRVVANALKKRGVIGKGRIDVIYNGIYCDEYLKTDSEPSVVREQLGIQRDDFFWIAVGNMRAEKDYPNMLDAFSRVAKTHPHAQLRIAGGFWDSALKARMEDLRRSYGLQDRVQFLGQRQDVPELLHAADAIVLSSRTEGLPNALMEAMATGLPVAATDVGGVRELVTEDQTGFLAASGDARGLAQAMSKLMRLSEQERAEMGRQAQRHIRENFELEIVAGHWEALFQQELLARQAVRSRWARVGSKG